MLSRERCRRWRGKAVPIILERCWFRWFIGRLGNQMLLVKSELEEDAHLHLYQPCRRLDEFVQEFSCIQYCADGL